MDSWKESALARKEYRQSPVVDDIPKHKKSKKGKKPFCIEYIEKEGEEAYCFLTVESFTWRIWYGRYKKLRDVVKAIKAARKQPHNTRYLFRIRGPEGIIPEEAD